MFRVDISIVCTKLKILYYGNMVDEHTSRKSEDIVDEEVDVVIGARGLRVTAISKLLYEKRGKH